MSFHFYKIAQYQYQLHQADKKANSYVYPFFHQDWRLFADNPHQQIKAYIYIPELGNLSPSQLIPVEALTTNLPVDETLKLGTYNSLFYLTETLNLAQTRRLPETPAALVARRWILSLWRHSSQFVPTECTIAIELTSEDQTCRYYLL